MAGSTRVLHNTYPQPFLPRKCVLFVHDDDDDGDGDDDDDGDGDDDND